MPDQDPAIAVLENRRKLAAAQAAASAKPAAKSKPHPAVTGLKAAAPKPKPKAPAFGSPEADDISRRAQALIDKYK